jgi:hypothetical protein
LSSKQRRVGAAEAPVAPTARIASTAATPTPTRIGARAYLRG